MAQPYVVQRGLALDLLDALAEDALAGGGAVRVEVALVDVGGEAYPYPADGLGEGGEALEVDDDGVVDPQPGQLLDGVLGAGGVALGGLADRERGVEHGLLARLGPAAVRELAGGDLHQGVPGDGDGHRVLPVGVDVEQEGGVGAAHLPLPAAQRTVVAGARVGADDQHVLAERRRGGAVVGEAVGAEGVDVVAQPQVRPARARPRQHGQRQPDGERGPQRAAGLLPAAPPGSAVLVPVRPCHPRRLTVARRCYGCAI